MGPFAANSPLYRDRERETWLWEQISLDVTRRSQQEQVDNEVADQVCLTTTS